MLVAELKPYNEIKSFIEKYKSVLVTGCGGCTALCNTGGLRETEALAAKLRRDINVKIKSVTIERQCEDEFVRELSRMVEGIDALLSMGCGAGVQLIAEQFINMPVYPALNTKFVGTSHDRRVFIERCRSCGECRLGSTAGICPVTRCAKGLQNGPCGGSSKGKCEISKDLDCAWQLVVDRLEALGKLDEYEKSKRT